MVRSLSGLRAARLALMAGVQAGREEEGLDAGLGNRVAVHCCLLCRRLADGECRYVGRSCHHCVHYGMVEVRHRVHLRQDLD